MKDLKLSAPDWCFFREGMGPEQYYGRLYDLGFRAVEMVDPSRWKAARDAGLKLLNISAPSIEKGLNRVENHAEMVPKIRDTMALAGDNKISQVIVFSGNREGQPDEAGIENCRKALEELLPDAARAGVTLTFEMLNVHDHPDYQADRGDYGFKLAGLVDSPELKLVYDVYHMERMGDDSVKDIVDNLPMIAHIHVAESPGRGLPKRDGTIPYGDIVPKVMAAGYDGYWGMEFEPEGDIWEELEATVKLWRELVR